MSSSVISSAILWVIVSLLVPTNATFNSSSTIVNAPPAVNASISSEPSFINVSCTPPAIESFPMPLIGSDVRTRGGIVIHLFMAASMALIIFVLLQDFFNPAADIIVERLGVDPEIAGGTFLAAAGSIPSLVASIVGLNVAQADVAVSSALGSGMLKATGVLGIAVLFSKGAVKLNVWSVFRSTALYLGSVLLILFIALDERIQWFEAVACLVFYGLYVTAMLFHESLRSVGKRLLGCSAPEKSSLECAEDQVIKCSVVIVIEDSTDDVPQAPAHSASKGPLQRMTAMVLRPFECLLSFVIPDCRQPETEKFFVLTFALSGCLIGVASYILVWMLAIIGFTFGIPESVLSLTFMSIASALPDVISSVMAVRQGLGNATVSCLLGSNIFDLLFGLGLPWFLQSSALHSEPSIQLLSSGLIYPGLGLLATILLLPVLTVVCGSKMNKVFGGVLLAWYIAFLTTSGLYQMNFFGDVSLPPCQSSF